MDVEGLGGANPLTAAQSCWRTPRAPAAQSCLTMSRATGGARPPEVAHGLGGAEQLGDAQGSHGAALHEGAPAPIAQSRTMKPRVLAARCCTRMPRATAA